MVRGTFSPARAWRPAVVARLARTLGVTNNNFLWNYMLLTTLGIANVGIRRLYIATLVAWTLGAAFHFMLPWPDISTLELEERQAMQYIELDIFERRKEIESHCDGVTGDDLQKYFECLKVRNHEGVGNRTAREAFLLSQRGKWSEELKNRRIPRIYSAIGWSVGGSCLLLFVIWVAQWIALGFRSPRGDA